MKKKKTRKQAATYAINPEVLKRLDRFSDKNDVPRAQIVQAGITRELDYRETQTEGGEK